MAEIVTCPSCEGKISLMGKIELGQRVRCPNCYDELEVIEINPLELDWPYEEREWSGANGSADDTITSPLLSYRPPDNAQDCANRDAPCPPETLH